MSTNRERDPLDPEAFARLEPILDGALDREGADREVFLSRACGGDGALRRRIDALLASDAAAGELLDRPLGDFAAALLERPLPAEGAAIAGRRFGPWRAVREIGRGGMGAVWLAERDDGAFEQRVAIKLVPGSLASPELFARFDQERRILARLEHPCIARLIDGGLTPEGVPWLAMEYVEGMRITDWCEDRRLTLAARLTLFERVAEAVGAAHQRLVVHCDLKPANILVNDAGEPRLLDFGIASLLEPGSVEGASAGRRLTPRYAAPEQLGGEPATTRTDVWALGVLLYEMLAGRHPLGDSRAPTPVRDAASSRHEPPPPSEVVDARHGLPFGAAELRGELDHVVRKAMCVDPAGRYDSARAIVEDLERWRTDRPVRAVPSTRAYRARKFLRRNRGLVLATSLVVLALLAGVVATTWQAHVARLQRDRATRLLGFLASTLAGAGPERLSERFDLAGNANPARPVGELVEDAAVRAARELSDDPQALGTVGLTLGEVLLAMRHDRFADTVLVRAESAFVRAGDQNQRHNAMHLRSLALLNQDRPAEAESLARRFVAYRRTRPGPVDLAIALMALNRAQVKLQRPAADSSLDEALRLLDGRVSDDHPLLLEGLNGRAVRRMAEGRDAAAESLFRRLLPLTERSLGVRHPRSITVRNNLGTSLFRQERYADAEREFRRVVEDRRAVLGPEHEDGCAALNALAQCVRDQGRLEEADSLFRAVIGMRRRLLGPEARATLVSESGLATVLRRQGRVAESEAIVRRVLAIRRRTLPHEDPLIASSLAALGECLCDGGRWAEAEGAFREALAIREAARPRNPRDVEKARAALDRAIRGRTGRSG